MTLENARLSSTSIIHINDGHTMDISGKLFRPICVDAEIKKKTKNGTKRRSPKQVVSEDDMPLAILAYQKGYFLDKRTSLSNPSLSSPTKTPSKRKHYVSSSPILPKKHHSRAITTKSTRKNHDSNTTATTETSKKENGQGYRHSFPVTENEHSSLRNIYHHNNNKNKKTELDHIRHRSPRQPIKSTCNWKLNDQNDRSPTSDTPTTQIHPLPKKKEPTTTTTTTSSSSSSSSSDACTTMTPEPTPQPKSIATCFSCLSIRRWSVSPLNRMSLKKKMKTNMCKLDSLI